MKTVLSLILALVVFAVSLAPWTADRADAACTPAITTNAKGLFLSGYFAAGTTYKIALYTQAGASLSGSTAIYTTSGELATANGYTQGGATLGVPTYGTSSTTYWIDWTSDPNWTSSTITADCYMIYAAKDDHASCTASGQPWPCCTGSGAGANCVNPAILIGTFTSTSSTNGTFTVVLPTADASNAIIRLQ